MFLLAKALFMGDGIASSPEKEVLWLQKAVDLNYPAAQFELARRLGLGEGVEQDVERGRELAIKAAKQGQVEAQMMLESLFKHR